MSTIVQTLDALEYAHNAEIFCVKLADGSFGRGRGLVHRNLKLGNIFLSKEDYEVIVKVGGYGLAKSFDLGLVEKPEIYFKSAREFKQALIDVF